MILLVPPLAFAGSAIVRLVSVDTRNRAGVVVAVALLALLKVEVVDGTWQLRATPSGWTQTLTAGTPDAEARALEDIAKWTDATDLLVTDEQMLAFRARRDIPAELCDTSYVRIASGSLRPDTAYRAAARARMVVLWTGRLARLPEFNTWVGEHYEPVLLLPSPQVPERGLYIRRSGAHVPSRTSK